MPDERADDRQAVRIWRCSMLTLAIGWSAVCCLGIAAVGLFVAAVIQMAAGDGGLVVGLAAGALAPIVIAIVIHRAAIRPQVALTRAGVEVRNPWSTVALSWEEVAGAEAGYNGVLILSRSGRPVMAWAVQKSNLSTWMKRSTRADQLVEAIRASSHA